MDKFNMEELLSLQTNVKQEVAIPQRQMVCLIRIGCGGREGEGVVVIGLSSDLMMLNGWG